jgi:hypothetical protein
MRGSADSFRDPSDFGRGSIEGETLAGVAPSNEIL